MTPTLLLPILLALQPMVYKDRAWTKAIPIHITKERWIYVTFIGDKDGVLTHVRQGGARRLPGFVVHPTGQVAKQWREDGNEVQDLLVYGDPRNVTIDGKPLPAEAETELRDLEGYLPRLRGK